MIASGYLLAKRREMRMNPDKVVFTKNKDGTYRVEVTCKYPDRTTVFENHKCGINWKDPGFGIPENITLLSDMASGAIYYTQT